APALLPDAMGPERSNPNYRRPVVVALLPLAGPQERARTITPADTCSGESLQELYPGQSPPPVRNKSPAPAPGNSYIQIPLLSHLRMAVRNVHKMAAQSDVLSAGSLHKHNPLLAWPAHCRSSDTPPDKKNSALHSARPKRTGPNKP